VVQKFILNIDMKKEIEINYWDNGQPMNEIPYLNGQWHGLKKWSFFNGNFWYKIPFKKDLQCGARVFFQY